jgi:MFS family permease
LVSPFLLDQHLFSANVGWRLGFGIGGALGFSILMFRRFVPESPRWLVTHCRSEEAEETVKQIEAHVVKSTGRDLPPVYDNLEVHPRKVFGIGLILTSMLSRYRQRSILALVLMVASV